ncbi:Hsp20/alpha crystallin family protein [Bailinhaonella thermotolerans]|uniref:Hsp20/alpha crystallin family protein n=1 Tax=Bailinhaonella thermotolerans TaxID=1070861 RepID=A0A3A4AY58_9ACTN|nr:Hsp20/alpha crystallin family protein [Bailinhaonella thermotolerans]RJL30773.1 Hsp20/alpha crystallin family protein [Bailinhaonella thermotolerans]
MLLTSIDPLAQELDRQMDRLSQRMFGWGEAARGSVMPMDAFRREDDVLLRFDIPGADADSVDVTVDRGVLTVTAQRTENLDKNVSVIMRERPLGTFTRRVYLAENLDTEKIEAGYASGVLVVRIPLQDAAKPRKVEIKNVDVKALH